MAHLMLHEMFRFSNIDLFDAVKEVDRGFSEQDTNAEPKETETSQETVGALEGNSDGKNVNRSQKSRKRAVWPSSKAGASLAAQLSNPHQNEVKRANLKGRKETPTKQNKSNGKH